MRTRKNMGFRWFCGTCLIGADDALRENRLGVRMDERIAAGVSNAMRGIEQKLERLKGRLSDVGGSALGAAPQFVDIVK